MLPRRSNPTSDTGMNQKQHRPKKDLSCPEKPWPGFWLDKPYYSFHAHCLHVYHEKLYKIALNAGMTCPGRDGSAGTRGCIFCSGGGSGDFAVPVSGLSIEEQIRQGISLLGNKRTGSRFIAYFQAYTNTYAPVSHLRRLYLQALCAPQIAGISIATRPDCLPEDVLALLSELRCAYPDKFIWIELGLQTIHQKTADYIRRGYALPCFTDAVAALTEHGIPVIVHLILGLPGESRDDMYETVSFLNTLPVFGVKLQLLHILRGTDLADAYMRGEVHVLEREEYISIVTGALERLSPKIVIHRLTGDGPRRLLLAPLWSLDKKNVLNRIHQTMRDDNIWQGKRCGKESHDTGK